MDEQIRVFDSLLDLVGKTPLVRLPRLSAKMGNVVAEVLGKCEFLNPLSSVKDRIALAMVKSAEDAGKLGSDSIIVEPTSGNTGIGLAFVCAIKNYRLVVVMPENMSVERRRMMHHLGAEIELTPADKGMAGAIERAHEICSSLPNTIMLNQFANAANPRIHTETTAVEIWRDTSEAVDVIVAGVGTGGTITGIGEVLKRNKPGLMLVAVEPEQSPVLSGGQAGKHQIQGIGAGFVPEIYNPEIIDEIITVKDEEAFNMAKLAARTEGLAVGISSGAALSAAFLIAQRREMQGKVIVTILSSAAERYLSTPLFEIV